MSRRAWWLSGLVAVAVHVPCAARAERADTQQLDQAIALEPGASCLRKERLVPHVRMWLGYSDIPASMQVRVRGDARRPDALSFDLIRGDQKRRRSFDPAPSSCDDAHAVLGLAIAMAIDGERMQSLWLNEKPEPALRLLVLQVTAAYEVLPNAALGVQAGVELGWSSWLSARLETFADYSWSNAIRGSAGSFDALLVAGSAQLCGFGWPDAQVRIGLCLGAGAGLVHAWGRGYAPSNAETGLWIAARNGLRIDAELGLRWALDLDVISSIYTPSFGSQRASGDELIRLPSPTGFSVSLGPIIDF